MQPNELGEIVRSHWTKLLQHHAHLQLDAFIVMPNHIHGILIVTDTLVGAGLAVGLPAQSVYRVSTEPGWAGFVDQ